MPMPQFAHCIYGLDGEPFRLTDRIAIRSFHVNNPAWDIRVWCPQEPSGPDWSALRRNTPLTVIRVHDPKTWNGHSVPHYQHRSDLLRHSILFTMGGLYFDTDTITLAPIPDDWLDCDTVIGREYLGGLSAESETIGLCNAVMLSKMHSRFQWLWLCEWQRFEGQGWNEFSVRCPWKLHKSNPGLCQTVDWQLLGPIYDQLDRYWRSSQPLEGCVIAHLWRTYSRGKMEALSEEVIRSRCNTYCLHAADYL